MMLSLSYPAIAQEDFKATSSSAVNLCPCSNQAYKITVENTGKETSSYRAIASGNISKWLSFNPARFSLNAGQKGSFVVSVNSECNIKGSFDAEIFIATEKNTAKSIKQKLNFTECYDYELRQGKALGEDEKISFTGYDGAYLICRNERKIIPVLIENKENFANRYTIKLDAPEWAKLALEKVQLEAKKSGLILINLDANNAAENADEEKFTFNIDALSELGKVNRKAGLEVNAAECYKLEVGLEKEKDVLCGGETKNYEIEINNIGAVGHEALLSIDGPEWASAGNNSIIIQPGEKGAGVLTLSPEGDVSGEFLIKANAEIENKELATFSDEMNVEVVPKFECYKAGITSKSKVKNHYQQDVFFVKLKNNGIRKANYTVSLEGISWANAKPGSIELNPGEKGNINIELNPDENVRKGSYTLNINLDAGEAFYSKSIAVEVKKENELVGKIKSGIRIYKYYIYLALAIIVLLAIIYKPVKRKYFKLKQSYEKYKAGQEKIRQRRLEKKLREEERQKEKQKELELREQEKEKELKKELKKTAEKRVKGARKGKPVKFGRNLLTALIFFIAILAIVFFANYSKSFNAKYLPIYISNFFVQYLYYILIGIGIAATLFLLVLIYERIKNKNENNKGNKEKRRKKGHKGIYFFAALAAAALVYATYYFKFLGIIKEFFILYLNYFIAGFALLIAIILLIRFYKPLFKMLKGL